MFAGNDNGTTKHVSTLVPLHFLARTHFCHLCSNLYQTLTMSKCWCHDLGMVAPWSDNFQASCNTCTWPIKPADSQRCTRHPVWSSAERNFISGSWISNPDGVFWCRDGGMVAPWSDNSQALCNISTCTIKMCSLYRCMLHSESARMVLLQMQVSGVAPGMSYSFLRM